MEVGVVSLPLHFAPSLHWLQEPSDALSVRWARREEQYSPVRLARGLVLEDVIAMWGGIREV